MSQDIQLVKGVGPALAEKFKKLKIQSIDDLIQYFPRRYDDFSVVTDIAKLKPGPVTIKAVIKQAKGRYVRRGMHITEAAASDATGSVHITWFNQPYRADSLKTNQEYYISGEFGLQYKRLSIMNPQIELVSEFPVNTARIVPIYRETKGLSSNQIRKVISEIVPALRQIPETLPKWMVEQYSLLSYAKAIEAIHFPMTKKLLTDARKRLAFQEVLEMMLTSLLVKREISRVKAVKISFHEAIAKQFVKHLPFSLTDAQRKVIWQSYQDMETEEPMNRLIEGDVGSGKTVVAAMAAVMAAHNGYQAALMAPTELLARQHAQTMYTLLEPLNMADKVVLLVGGMKNIEKDRAREAIAAGRAQIVIGTHALIQDSVDMHKLALVIIDEQHRFGVEQRKKLMAKAGAMPHVLSLTATPIPRSLALTLYGEMDVSLLDVKPGGRQPVLTSIESPNSRTQLYAQIENELAAGRQMFVVCPLITESAVSSGRSVEVVSAELGKAFKHRRIGMLHGKMKAADKNEIMELFVAHEIDILVSTTVIEVGVDVPNASIMLVEAAEQFGLAQIHQLRGRVGRGGHKGYCYLMMSDSKAPTKRLRALESSNDGFKLAELDMELRGPGAIYGTLQHGELDLRIATLSDTKLLHDARRAAEAFLDSGEDLLHYPQLSTRIHALQKVTNLN